MSANVIDAPEPQILRIFISYASEDVVIATALSKCLRDALGDAFAEISIDRWFLQAGAEFKRQIEATLEKTDVFISLYTGLNKQWPAWEVGFFERVMRDPAKAPTSQRAVVPMFLDAMPPTIAGYQGIGLSIKPEHLQGSSHEFDSALQEIGPQDPMCQFLVMMQSRVDSYRAAGGFPQARRTEDNDPVRCVRTLKQQIFRYLKTTVEDTIRPQKQLLIRTSGAALENTDLDLPANATLIPVGQGNPMSSIFGLTDTERTWQKFVEETASNEHAESWRTAIFSVVTSSFPSRVDVDNSQIVVSNDNSKTYRVILSSTIKYFDDKREFNFYFVQSLPRTEFGDELTTLLLRALELSCRFRFMFFEKSSPFSAYSIRLANAVTLPTQAARIMRELNLLRKDARDVGLDEVGQWLKLVEPGHLATVMLIYKEKAAMLNKIVGRILEARGDAATLEAVQTELVTALEQMRESVEPGNLQLIQEMTDRLRVATRGSQAAETTKDS